MERALRDCLIIPRPVIDSPEQKYNVLDIKTLTMNAIQDGLFCQITIEETFSHTSPSKQEIKCIYPVSKSVCLYNVKFFLGEEQIEIKLQEKKAAIEAYEEAKSKGEIAVIGKRLNEKLVEFSVGNVDKNVECKLILTAILPLRFTNGKLDLDFDLSLADPTNGFVSIMTGFKGVFKFELKSCYSGATIENGIITEIKQRIQSTISLAEPLQSEVSLSQKNAIITTFAEDLESVKSVDGKSDYCFIVDCSGSMGGGSIKKVSEALNYFIRSLPAEGTRIQLVRFGSTFEPLFSEFRDYNASSVQEVKELSDNLKANFGGTNLHDPLKYVLDHIERPTQIFVLTDGDIQDTEKVISLVATNRSKARIFTLGIGKYVDKYLVSKLSDSTMGRYDFVTENCQIAEKVLGLLDSATSNYICDVEVHVEGNDSISISPMPIPPSYVGFPSTLIVESEQPISDSILVTGKSSSEPVELVLNPRECSFSPDAIHALYSFKMIHDLEYQRLSNNCTNKEEIEQKEIALSISSGVLCDFTAFVGISRIQPSANCGVMLEDAPIIIPNKLHSAACSPRFSSFFKNLFKKKTPESSDDCDCAVDECIIECVDQGVDDCVDECVDVCVDQGVDECVDVCVDQGVDECVDDGGDSCPAPPPASPPSEISDIQYFNRLVDLQDPAGWWKDVKTVLEAVNLAQVPEGIGEGSDQVLGTLLAVVLFRTRFASFAKLWKIMERKAISWLKANCNGIDIEQRIAAIKL